MQRLKDLGKTTVTRYDIYNCITQYATHYPLLTLAVKENMERLSMKVLAKPLEIPEAVEEE